MLTLENTYQKYAILIKYPAQLRGYKYLLKKEKNYGIKYAQFGL